MTPFLAAGPFSARDGEGRLLFEGVEIALAEGEAVVLDGPSGCGKSRLLRQLVALDAPPMGARSLRGRTYAGRSLPAWRSRVTLLAQDAPVLPGSVRAGLEAAFTFRAAQGRRFDSEAAKELMSKVGLGRLPLDRDVGTLSGGERHRLALVRGLLWDPPVLVADEPLSGLDPESAAGCFDLLLGFARREGHALIAVFHDPDFGRAADRMLRLSNGTLEER